MTKKLYYPVIYKKRTGALIVREENVCFYDDDKLGQKVLEIEWLLVAKITGNVSTSPSALLKLTMANKTAETFKFDSRKDLNQAKYDMKVHWNACRGGEGEASMRSEEEEDITETTRRDDECLFMNDKSSKSNNTGCKSEPLATTTKRRLTTTPTVSTTKISNTSTSNKRQQSPRPNRRRASTGTNYLPRIDSGASLEVTDSPPKRRTIKRGHSEKVLHSKKNFSVSKQNFNYNTSSTKKVSPPPPLKKISNNSPPPSVLSFSKKSQIQMLPNDRILLPRNRGDGNYYRLNFNNFIQSQAIEIAIVNDNKSNTAPRKRRMVNLEDLIQQKGSYNDIEAQQQNGRDDENTYRITKRVCKTSIMIATCGFCLLVGMTVAVIVLSILLAEAKQQNEASGGSTGGPLTDDFYSEYFENFT